MINISINAHLFTLSVLASIRANNIILADTMIVYSSQYGSPIRLRYVPLTCITLVVIAVVGLWRQGR